MWNSTSIMACACRLSIHRLQRGCNPLKRTLFTAAVAPRLVKFNTVEPTSSPTLSEMRQFFKSNGCQVSTGYTCLKLACPYCVEQKEVADKGARSKENQLYVNMTTGRIFKEKIVCVLQCCVTRVGTWTRVHFTRTRTRVQFFSLWLGLGLRNRDSWLGPESRPSPSSSSRAVLHCLLWHSIHFVVFMFWKNKFWICGLLDLWLGLKNFFWLGLADSDSDFEVMTRTRTRTRIWQPGLGHSTGVLKENL